MKINILQLKKPGKRKTLEKHVIYSYISAYI